MGDADLLAGGAERDDDLARNKASAAADATSVLLPLDGELAAVDRVRVRAFRHPPGALTLSNASAEVSSDASAEAPTHLRSMSAEHQGTVFPPH